MGTNLHSEKNQQRILFLEQLLTNIKGNGKIMDKYLDIVHHIVHKYFIHSVIKHLTRSLQTLLWESKLEKLLQKLHNSVHLESLYEPASHESLWNTVLPLRNQFLYTDSEMNEIINSFLNDMQIIKPLSIDKLHTNVAILEQIQLRRKKFHPEHQFLLSA